MTDELWSIWTYVTEFFSTPERITATVLTLSTIGLWWSTRRLWKVTGIAAQHIPHVERAYISGGANVATRTFSGDHTIADPSRLVVTINNFGKTPAFIGTVAVATCDKLEPKFSGPWERQEWKGYVLPAPTYNLRSDVDCNYEQDKIIFGRIWYRDIFMKHHSCGFALYMREGLPAVPGHETYWEDRDERDLGPAKPTATI